MTGQPPTLIHLVSHQRMQNLLPMLAIRPGRVVHVISDAHGFSEIADHLENAARQSGLECVFERQSLGSKSPDINETVKVCESVLNGLDGPVVINITGGTKLMSIGAYEAASRGSDVEWIYCDSESGRFVHGGTPLLSRILPAFSEVTGQLSIELVMAAHGRPADSWKFAPVEDHLLRYGKECYQVYSGNIEALRNYRFNERVRDFFRRKGQIPGSAAELRGMMELDILQAMPDPVPAAVHSFLENAVNAGLLLSDGEALRMVPCDGNRSQLKSHVQKISNLLTGIWVELFVLDVLRQWDQCLDVRWSVEPSSSDSVEGFGETDIAFLRRDNGALGIISCKSDAPDKMLEHLESLKDRATNLGGRFARPYLYVFHAEGRQLEHLRRHAKSLGVELLLGDEIHTKLATSASTDRRNQ